MTTIRSVAHASELGPTLREARIDDGMTQSALAQIAGVGRQWLNSFELGEKPSAPLDMVMRVIAALRTPVTLTIPPTPANGTAVPEIDLDALLRQYNQ